LFGGRSSRLVSRLFRDEELVTDAHGSVAPFADSGLYEIWLSLRPGKEPDHALRIIDDELDKLRRKPVTRAELDKVKNRMELGFLQGLETASGKAEQLGFFEIVMGDGAALFSRLEALRAVTPRDIQRVANRYFDARRRTRISVVPERANSAQRAKLDEVAS
jgi:zinc protease